MAENEPQNQPQSSNEDNNQSDTRSTSKSPAATKKAAKKGGKKRRKRSSKRSSKKAAKRAPEGRRRGGGAGKPYPTATFESVLPLAQTIYEHAGASREMRRVTVFEILGRASESGPGRALVINSARYGLTAGGTQAELLRLTDEAFTILNPNTPPAEATRTRFNLAIQGVAPFNALYQRFRGGRLPAAQVMRDALEGVEGVEAIDRQECVDIFVGNLNYIGLLSVVEGAQWIINIDTEIDRVQVTETVGAERVVSEREGAASRTDFDSICFFIAPIGDEQDEERKHSDMVLGTLVAPALEPFKLNVIRADQIATPGMISKQVIEHILKSRLVIVDMSFHNPNVFYELAIRHLLGKPTVHIIKKSDGIPFDVGNFRTIELEDVGYEFVARIETYRAMIANYTREALDGSSSADNPILTFFPELKVTLSTEAR